MTATKGSDNRVVLPRWRAWRDSRNSGELEPLRSQPERSRSLLSDSTSEAEISQRLADFKAWNGTYEAADVVNAAIVLGLEDYPGVHEAAKTLRGSSLPAVSELAERILSHDSSKSDDILHELESRANLDAVQSRDEDGTRVAWLRSIVQSEPRNSLRWADLALAHTVLGNKRPAARAIRVAVSLADGNRFILRAAARFHVHEGDFDAAHSILTANMDNLVADPWLMAAEIAIADMSGQRIRYTSHGRQLLAGDFPPRHISELASALATLELKAGRIKRARKLFEQALEDPTENSLAQAEWSMERGINVLPPTHLHAPQDFEAETRHSLRLEKFRDAAIQARLWQEDQPFALEPATHASYIASTLAEDYKLAIIACEKGLIANPGDPILLNNLAFSQANAGLIEAAKRNIGSIVMADDAKKLLIRTATSGLIAFRQNDPHLGRELYQESIIGWTRQENGNVGAAMAAIFWAREEIRARSQHVIPALKLVDSLCDKIPPGSDVDILRHRLIDDSEHQI